MEINICFGINNDYSQHCGCTIASILYNSNPNDQYNIYIVTDYISEYNKQKFKQLKTIRDYNIEYLNIDASEFENLNVNNNIGVAAFYRFKAFKILNVNRYIYLDSDIIVRKDITELYNTDIENYYCAGVEDILNPILKQKYSIDSNSLYINSGVMLINQNLCKTHNIYEQLINFVRTPWDIPWGDQDIINKIFENKIKGVDIKWNCLYPYNNYYSNKDYYYRMAKNPCIMHYITDNKPWKAGSNPHLKTEYFKYLKMTPWYEDFIDLYKIEENNLIIEKLTSINNIFRNIAKQ